MAERADEPDVLVIGGGAVGTMLACDLLQQGVSVRVVDRKESRGKVFLLVDGGIRRGSDVLKALALGARFVFVGRPLLYAAAVGGEAGVLHAIDILSTEINRNMGLLGINTLNEMRSELLVRLKDV